MLGNVNTRWPKIPNIWILDWTYAEQNSTYMKSESISYTKVSSRISIFFSDPELQNNQTIQQKNTWQSIHTRWYQSWKHQLDDRTSHLELLQGPSSMEIPLVAIACTCKEDSIFKWTKVYYTTVQGTGTYL